MLLDLRFEQLLAMCPQALERADLVLLHEPAVPDHVGSHDGGELALHSGTIERETRTRLLYNVMLSA